MPRTPAPAISTTTFGVPLSLARLPQGAAYGVFEVGMNHPGEIGPLSRLLRPHTALITTIAAVHTAFFSGIDAVADAKAEIFEGLEAGGTAVLNRDDAYFDRLAAAARSAGAGRIVSFGEERAGGCPAPGLEARRLWRNGHGRDRRRRGKLRDRLHGPALGAEQRGRAGLRPRRRRTG